MTSLALWYSRQQGPNGDPYAVFNDQILGQNTGPLPSPTFILQSPIAISPHHPQAFICQGTFMSHQIRAFVKGNLSQGFIMPSEKLLVGWGKAAWLERGQRGELMLVARHCFPYQCQLCHWLNAEPLDTLTCLNPKVQHISQILLCLMVSLLVDSSLFTF